MRAVPLFLLLVLSVGSAQAAFGAGEPAFIQVDAPGGLPNADNAGEPTIGINWATDAVFFQAYSSTYKINQSADGSLEWVDVTSSDQLAFNLDPMLHTDPVTGRTWAGGLLAACSYMLYTDDDGTSWNNMANQCGVYGVDHQTLGSGPWAGDAPPIATYDHAVYYCAHGEAVSSPLTDPAFSVVSPTACVTSYDGGVTWGDPVPWVGGCGSLHGHVRVSPVTGFAAVPDADCATAPGSTDTLAGYAYSTDNGITWMSGTVEGSVARPGFDNPSMAFGHDEGWLWYGQASTVGVNIALSKDEGATWEALPQADGTLSTWVDVGAFHDPPVVWGTFADVMVGDDDRIALAFLGLEDTDGDGLGEEFAPRNTCNAAEGETENRLWHYYVATSYDGGQDWTVTKATKDPVQIGGIYQGQETETDPSLACRNLLDFNDMDIDSTGRIYVGFADGCIAECAATAEHPSEGSRTHRAALLMQTNGKGLFAEFDGDEVVAPRGDLDDDGVPNEEDDDIDGDGIMNEEDDDPTTFDEPKKGIPAAGPIAAMMALAVALVLRRR